MLIYPGNNEPVTPQPAPQPKPKPEPTPAPAPQQGVNLVAYSVDSLDSIINNHEKDFVQLLSDIGQIAQKIKDGNYPKQKQNPSPIMPNIEKRLAAQKLADGLAIELTDNWDMDNKGYMMFHSNPTIGTLFSLSQSARNLLAVLIKAIAYERPLSAAIELRRLTSNNIDNDLKELITLSDGTKTDNNINTLNSSAMDSLENLAQKTTRLETFAPTKKTTPQQLFKQFPAIIEPLLKIGEGISENTQRLFKDKKMEHIINMQELENEIARATQEKELQELSKVIDEILNNIDKNNQKDELAKILQDEKIAKNKSDSEKLALGIILAGIGLKALQHTDPIVIQHVGNNVKYMIGNAVMATLPTTTINNFVLPKPLPSVTRIIPPANYTPQTAPFRPLPRVTGGNAQIQRGLHEILRFIKRAPR